MYSTDHGQAVPTKKKDESVNRRLAQQVLRGKKMLIDLSALGENCANIMKAIYEEKSFGAAIFKLQHNEKDQTNMVIEQKKHIESHAS